jgi:hypothetical protein
VFPAAWYPSITPSKIQRRTVPCCAGCNERLHDAEDAVVLDLLFICNPGLPEIAGVQENVSRAWKPQHARDPHDQKHRAGKTLKILRTMEWPAAVVGAPLVFVQKPGSIYRPASPARSIDKKAMRVVIEKFIRGLHYLQIKKVLRDPNPHPPDLDPLLPLDTAFQYSLLPNQLIRLVDPRLTLNDFAPELIEELRKSPVSAMFGPGFLYRCLRTPQASMWLFRLWGQLELVAFAYPPLLAAEVAKKAGLS